MDSDNHHFDELVRQALAQDFSGWDFSYIRDRWQEEKPPWDYRAIVLNHLQNVETLLDMGTGGGEFLASLAPLPTNTHATEAWEPNIAVAKKRLEPLGISVHGIEEYAPLPFPDSSFELVINRHDWYDPNEVYRILKDGGRFITQQVGAENDLRLNELISGKKPEFDEFNLDSERRSLEAAGFIISQAEEAFPDLHFFDVGAIVYYLKVVEWQIPDFDVQTYRSQLLDIHNMLQRDGKLTVKEHRFMMVAYKPEI